MKSHSDYMGIPARVFVKLNGKVPVIDYIFIASLLRYIAKDVLVISKLFLFMLESSFVELQSYMDEDV